jgi:hypothetical protein
MQRQRALPFRHRPCFDWRMQQPIRIETLGDLAARGYGLNALCERCRHRADLDMQGLIAKLGTGFRYVGKALDQRLACSRCGEKAVKAADHGLGMIRPSHATGRLVGAS